MQRDPNVLNKARRAERRAEEKSGLISIKPIKVQMPSTAPGPALKKSGFKTAFGGAKTEVRPASSVVAALGGEPTEDEQLPEASKEEQFDYPYYDPRVPTGCAGGSKA